MTNGAASAPSGLSSILKRIWDLFQSQKQEAETEMRARYQSREIQRNPFSVETGHKRTKPATVDFQKAFCAVLRLLCTGWRWRLLPSEFSNGQTGKRANGTFAHRKVARTRSGQDKPSEADFKKSGWQGLHAAGVQRGHNALGGGRAKREKHGHGSVQRHGAGKKAI